MNGIGISVIPLGPAGFSNAISLSAGLVACGMLAAIVLLGLVARSTRRSRRRTMADRPVRWPPYRRIGISAVLALLLLASLLALGRLGSAMMSTATRALSEASARPSVLIVFDDAGENAYIGELYSVLLENLLGHFDVAVRREAVSAYAAGHADAAAAVFYVGSTAGTRELFAEKSPQRAAYNAFLTDAARVDKPLVWIGANLGALQARMGERAFAARFGFAFRGDDDGYNRVRYKGVELGKGVARVARGVHPRGCVPETEGQMNCNTGLGVAAVTDPRRASVVAQAFASGGGKEAAYVTHGGNLWYVGDVPFSYVTEGDRYLVFADLLHDMLGIDHDEDRRALVRLEDVTAKSDLRVLSAAVKILQHHQAPFGVAAIPYYRDPALDPPGGPAVAQGLAGTEIGQALARFVDDAGAFIVQHGTTHQWDDGPNPDNGVSGSDYEFYRVTRKADGGLNFVGPVPQDSPEWVRDRLQRGRAELERAKLPVTVWEAPHYLASTADYRVGAEMYRGHWGRMAYFGWSRFGTPVEMQYFPYAVRDSYRQTVIPENLGNITPHDPATTPEDIVQRARQMLVVRDGVASFFFHPYLDPALLDRTLAGIRSLGYRFVEPCRFVDAC